MGHRPTSAQRMLSLDLPNTPGAVVDPSQHPLVDTDDLDADDVFKVVADDDEDEEDDDEAGCGSQFIKPIMKPVTNTSTIKAPPSIIRGHQKTTIADVEVLVPLPGVSKR